MAVALVVSGNQTEPFRKLARCRSLASLLDAVVVAGSRECGAKWRHLSWVQLRDEVVRDTSAPKQAGGKRGDRIVSGHSCCK